LIVYNIRKIINWFAAQTLERDLTVGVALVSVIVVMILGLINYFSLIRVAENELEQRIERTNSMIVRRLTRLMADGRHNEAAAFLDQFKHHSPITGLRLFDNDDNILFNYDSSIVDTGAKTHSLETPVIFEDRQYGRICLIAGAESIQLLRTNMFRLTLSIITALSVTLFVTVRLIVNRVLTASLRKIQNGVRVFAEGNFSYRIDPGSYHDLQPITREINIMARKISERTADLETEVNERKRTQDALKKLNEELEIRVESRTADFEVSNRALKESLNLIRQTQLQLIESEKLASLGSMVAGVAHEINNPLGISVTAASHLENKLQKLAACIKNNALDDIEDTLFVIQESTQIIRSNLKRASELVSGFKKVAIDQTGEEKSIFNMYHYLKEIILSLRPELKKAVVKVNIDCPEDLSIENYPGAISQILTNLILNTMRHGFKGRKEGRIDIRVFKELDQMNLVYSDNGVGIPDIHRSKIFDPFFTTERGTGSSGLGLHIVFSIVTNKLKGTITCETPETGGCIFHFRIPASELGTGFSETISSGKTD
jgi:signal transduction histidine kinase